MIRPANHSTSPFQFTPLARGATGINAAPTFVYVSIHAPRTRGDTHYRRHLITLRFQFTPLARGATRSKNYLVEVRSFNSRPSHEGRLVGPVQKQEEISFNSRPSHEGRLSGFH